MTSPLHPPVTRAAGKRSDMLMRIHKARMDRAAQAKHRGSRRSIATECEDALMFLAWESADLSEGQMARILDVDRITLRKKREALIERGLVIAEALAKAGGTQ